MFDADRCIETTTLQAYHFMLPKLLSVRSDLQLACNEICSPNMVTLYPSSRHKPQLLDQKAMHFFKPEVGVKVGRGEFVKATSCKHAARLAKGRVMAMERKYDGEYAQIHIDTSKGADWIKIFSKSGKESTWDREAIHAPLRDALQLDNSEARKFNGKCIMEGEVLVYNTRAQDFMPFDHIRRHIRRSGMFIEARNDPPRSPNSHLMVVLFDLLLVDESPMLETFLPERTRRLHEIVVSPKPGYCQFAERTEIDFSLGRRAVETMMERFAEGIRKRWEGFVLKPCNTPYFDANHRRADKTMRGFGFAGSECSWIKLKKDYINGLGDHADFAVIGGYSENRRAMKMGYKLGQMNTFHVAALTNKAAVEMHQTKPRLKVLFEVSYSIGRSDLEWIRRLSYFNTVDYEASPRPPVQTLAPNPPQPGISMQNYDLDFPPELQISKPTKLFASPLIFEVMGGSFEKQTNCTFFTPRHPRVTKIHWDRSLTDIVTLDDLQEMAVLALGGKTPDMASSQEERMWIQKLQRGDMGKQLELTPQRSERSEITPSPYKNVYTLPPPKAPRWSRGVVPVLTTAPPCWKDMGVVSLQTTPGSAKRPPSCWEDMGVVSLQTTPGSAMSGSGEPDASPLRKKLRCTLKRPAVVIDLTGDTEDGDEDRPVRNPQTPSTQLLLEPKQVQRPADPYFFTHKTAARLSHPTPISRFSTTTTPFSTPPTTPFYTPPTTPHDDTPPLLGATVYLLPTLMKFSCLIERLVAHGVASFDVFDPQRVDEQDGGIVMIDAEYNGIGKEAIRALGGQPDGKWEVWDWRVVRRPTVQELRPGERGRWGLSRMA